MAIREIEILGSDVLRREADPIPAEEINDDLRDLVDDMFETMYHADGVGLAAPQIGISRRLLVVDVPGPEDEDGKGAGRRRLALVNPRVVESSKDRDRSVEGCLSIPGMEEVVERPWAVVVEALDPEGKEVRIEADDLLARALQHEIDHLDGILFISKMTPADRIRLKRSLAELEERYSRRK